MAEVCPVQTGQLLVHRVHGVARDKRRAPSDPQRKCNLTHTLPCCSQRFVCLYSARHRPTVERTRWPRPHTCSPTPRPHPRLSPPCPTGCCSSKTGTYSASRRLGHRAYLTLVWLNLAANKSAHRSVGNQTARRLLPAPASRSRWPLANPPYETNPFPGGWEGKQEKLIRTVLRGTSDELPPIRSVNAVSPPFWSLCSSGCFGIFLT